MKNKNESNEPAKQGEKQPSSPKGDDRTKSTQESKARKQSENIPKGSFIRWTFCLEALLVMATCATVGVAYFQWQAMKKQTQLAERAWVFNKELATTKFEGGIHGRCIKKGEKSTFEVILKNIGKTPAHVTNVRTYLRIIKTGEKPVLDKEAIISSTKNPFIMFPETTRTTGDNLTEIFTKERFEAIESRQATLYILGVISYKDIFGQLHWTEFCESLDPNLSSFSPCPFYNETDDAQNTK